MTRGIARPGPWLLAIAATAFAALAAEAGLRIFRPVPDRPTHQRPAEWTERLHQASELPGLAYELAPNRRVAFGGALLATNSVGMRDVEPGPPGPAYRIVVLGDSVTFGYGVTAEQAYPSVLRRALHTRTLTGELPAEVLNFGVSGYSTRDEWRLLAGRVTDFEPDLVIVGYSLNDPEIEPIQPLHAHFLPRAWWEESHLLRLIARARRAAAERSHGGDYYRFLHDEGSAPWRSVADALAAIGELGRVGGYDALLAVFPTFLGYDDWASYPYSDLHEQVARVARDAGFRVVDVLDVFRSSGRAPADLRADLEHPNALGHAVAAEALADALGERIGTVQ